MFVPESNIDFYSRAAIRDPASTYRRIREVAPVVRLLKHDVLAVGRYDTLRSLLKNSDDFISSQGVTMNTFMNDRARASDTVIVSDGEQHTRLRKHMMAPMRPREIESIRPRIQASADEKVAALVGRGRFDAMAELASHLPVTIVAELVGLKDAGRARMMGWSKATFDLIGPMNWRAVRSFPRALGMLRFQGRLKKEQVVPGGWVHRLFELRDEGTISHQEALGMVIDYLAPSLDTTTFATGHLLNRLARHPEAWRSLVEDPSLIPATIAESLRLDSVVRAFTRVAARDVELDGFPIAAGERILLLYGAANRDRRHYPDPDRFEITRDARDHLAFGHGAHACAGTRLAQMEMEALLRSILEHVREIRCGTPRVASNNTLHGFSKLPIELIAR